MLCGGRISHVVCLKEWFESKERFYLVFELAQGGELYEHLMEEGRFAEDEAREVILALTVSKTPHPTLYNCGPDLN